MGIAKGEKIQTGLNVNIQKLIMDLNRSDFANIPDHVLMNSYGGPVLCHGYWSLLLKRSGHRCETKKNCQEGN
jgi:hypothetical protein